MNKNPCTEPWWASLGIRTLPSLVRSAATKVVAVFGGWLNSLSLAVPIALFEAVLGDELASLKLTVDVCKLLTSSAGALRVLEPWSIGNTKN